MEKLSEILSAHEDLLDNRNFDELYTYVPRYWKSLLTYALYIHGVDPTQYFEDTIPEYFASDGGWGGNLIPTEIVLPNNILYMEDSAFCDFFLT